MIFFCVDEDGTSIALNEDIQCSIEVKKLHSLSGGSVVILSNIRKTEPGEDKALELLLVHSLIKTHRDEIGWIIIPMEMDYDISLVEYRVLTMAFGFIYCDTPGGSYLVWTNHDICLVGDLHMLTPDEFIKEFLLKKFLSLAKTK